MKFTVDVDCTPDEARAFLGLPDIAAMQAAMIKEIEERLKTNLAAMDPETLFKSWMPTGMGLDGMEQMQKAFFARFGGGKE
ncbi:MAG TPA: hypothetical protein ENI69_01905 [Rhodospirillales bacterium]|nr:hypothetical protein [Rhodospirillales bacterium]